jgi:hypothetical protein
MPYYAPVAFVTALYVKARLLARFNAHTWPREPVQLLQRTHRVHCPARNGEICSASNNLPRHGCREGERERKGISKTTNHLAWALYLGEMVLRLRSQGEVLSNGKTRSQPWQEVYDPLLFSHLIEANWTT